MSGGDRVRTVIAMTTAAARDVVLELASAHAPARAIQVVADLGVADAISEHPRTEEELAVTLGVDADALGRVLRLLEAYGVFVRDGDRAWNHNDASRLLRTDDPGSLRSYVRMSGTPFNWGSFTHLEYSLRTGKPGVTQLGAAGWLQYLDAHPDEHEVFQDAMTAKARADVAAVLATYDFGRHERVADVGGGHGHLVDAVLARHPGVHGVLFELPQVASEVTPHDRLDVVGGDFFVDPLPACDAYVLMNVIHDWDDDKAVTILAAAADAGKSRGASVLLVEAILPEGAEPHRAKVLDAMMLAVTGGRERTLRQYERLLSRAGLELVAKTPTATTFSIIEARPR
jgi:hypothetical protein